MSKSPSLPSQYQTFSNQMSDHSQSLHLEANDVDSVGSFQDESHQERTKSGKGLLPGNASPKNAMFSLQFLFSKLLYIITGLIIIIVLGIIIFVLIVMSQTREDEKGSFEFDDMFNASYGVKSWNVFWEQGNDADDRYVIYYQEKSQEHHHAFESLRTEFSVPKKERSVWESTSRSANDDEDAYQCSLRLFSVAEQSLTSDDQGQILIPRATLAEKKLPCGMAVQFDSSLRYFAFKTEVETIFRYSTKGAYIIYDRTEEKWMNLSNQMKQKTYTLCSATQSYWVGEDNNIYMFNPSTNTNVAVTSDGDRNLIYNGISDWVYEEDVWETDVLFTVSPECDQIAFLRLNDSAVQDYHYVTYDVDSQYPKHDITKYPAAGSGIPSVSIRVAKCDDNSCSNSFTRDLSSGPDQDGWVFQLAWPTNDQLLFTTTNRIQSMQYTHMWDATSNTERTISIFDPTTENLSWVQYPKSIIPLPSGTSAYLEIKPKNDYYHIRYCYFGEGKNCIDEKEDVFLTSGDYNVISILAVKGTIIYFAATLGIEALENKALRSTQQYVYQLDLAYVDKPPVRLPGQSEANAFYSASLSASGNSYSLTYQGPSIPTSYLVVRKNPQDEKPQITTSEDNETLRKLYSSNSLELPTTEVTSVKLNGEEMDLLLVKPPKFREALSYPVLLYFYGGPGSKMVTQQFRAQHSAFSMYMASRGFIVATLDNRGTGLKTASFMQMTYKRLGVVEAEDQNALKEYLSELDWVDRENIMLWGWSYGGTLSSTTALRAKEPVFRAAISVAPVTKWSYYNAAYTERFMQTPQMNPDGYQETSIVDNIKKSTFNGTNYLLNHGTADDNVHPLNTWNLVSRLQEHEIQFNLMAYPNKDHSIAGAHTQLFLYRKLSEHLMGSLKEGT